MKKPRTTIHRHNEAKYLILKALFTKTQFTTHKYLSPREIAKRAEMPLNVVTERLRRYTRQGYIWRRQEYRARGNKYCYGFPKPKGIRVFILLDERVVLQQETGVQVPLNLKKPVPEEARMKRKRQGIGGYT